MDVAVLQAELESEFSLRCTVPSLVAGGQDTDAWVLRTTTTDGQELAVKVSRAGRSSGLLVSHHLATQGLPGIPAPYLSRTGAPYSDCHAGQVSVTPWIAGRAGAEGMTAEQWREFGALLARVHATRLPPAIAARLPREDYLTPATAGLREVDRWLTRLAADPETHGGADPLCRQLAQSWTTARPGIRLVAEQTEVLSDELRQNPAPAVLCHGDAHTFNTVIDGDGRVWLLDWDEVVLAPRERDLMFQIGGVLAEAQVQAEQQSWFFDGYGPVDVDARRLAYYRCSWSVQDLAAFAGRVRDLSVPTPEREEASRFLTAILSPTGIVAAALASLEGIGRSLR